MSKTPQIEVLKLLGRNYRDLGKQYGTKMKPKLEKTLEILYKHFHSKHGISKEDLYIKALGLFARFPLELQKFITGIADGSKISFKEAVILNGMETLPPLVNNEKIKKIIRNSKVLKKDPIIIKAENEKKEHELGACSFFSIPAEKSYNKATLVGRNYDFPEPFGEIAKYLTVTVLKDFSNIPIAFISMPGQIYCPTCINKNSIFIEFNNGTPSGGKKVNDKESSLLSFLFKVGQKSHSMEALEDQLYNYINGSTKSDYSLIVNSADSKQVNSHEISSSGLGKKFTPGITKTFVSTNYYLNETWKNNPFFVIDSTTWHGVSRKKNLEYQLQKRDSFSFKNVKEILDKRMDKGEKGASWIYTIYQIAFNTGDGELCLKTTKHTNAWSCFTHDELFQNTCGDYFCQFVIEVKDVISKYACNLLPEYISEFMEIDC